MQTKRATRHLTAICNPDFIRKYTKKNDISRQRRSTATVKGPRHWLYSAAQPHFLCRVHKCARGREVLIVRSLVQSWCLERPAVKNADTAHQSISQKKKEHCFFTMKQVETRKVCKHFVVVSGGTAYSLEARTTWASEFGSHVCFFLTK